MKTLNAKKDLVENKTIAYRKSSACHFFQVYQKFEGYQISVFLAVSFDVLKAISPYIYFLGI